jgi:Na+/glutamate symporter
MPSKAATAVTMTKTPRDEKMTNQIAMFTAILATVGALFGYMGGATQANAGLFKNNAAHHQNRGLQPVELLPGQKHQAVTGRTGTRPGTFG